MKNKVKSQTEICRAMVALRKSSKVSQVDVAREAGYSGAYLAYLELGYRRWNDSLVAIFTEAIRRAVITKRARIMSRMAARLQIEGCITPTRYRRIVASLKAA